MQAASEAEVEAPGVGLERSLGFHATDAPACMRRVNAQEVLSKKQADAVVSVAMPARAEATNTRIVGGETPSVGGDAMRAMDPWWARTDTLVIMFNVEREARELDAFIASHTEGDATNAVLTVGNKSYGGFGDYGVTFSPILDPTVQRASTVLLKRKFFLAPSIRTNGITPIHTLERAVRNKIEMLAAERGQAMDLHLLQAHIIRQGCLLACWGAHVDNRGALKSANITAVTNLTEYETAMRICGARSHADYSRQGRYGGVRCRHVALHLQSISGHHQACPVLFSPHSNQHVCECQCTAKEAQGPNPASTAAGPTGRFVQ